MFNNQIIQKSNKPKTIRLKKLELFKIPIYNNKIKLKNKFNNNKKIMKIMKWKMIELFLIITKLIF